MPIELKPLVSDHLESAGYDEETQVLDIVFRDGGGYSYDAVPKNVADGLFSAASPSWYFRNMIKGRYRFYKT